MSLPSKRTLFPASLTSSATGAKAEPPKSPIEQAAAAAQRLSSLFRVERLPGKADEQDESPAPNGVPHKQLPSPAGGSSR